jgi:hypothetical protein
MSKRDCDHRRQTSLIQAYRNLLSDTSASILAVSTLRNSLSMYFFLIACFINSSPEVTFRTALVIKVWRAICRSQRLRALRHAMSSPAQTL